MSTKPVIYDQAAVGSVGWNMLEGQHVCLAHWYLGIVDKNNLDEIVRWVVSLIDTNVKVPYKFPERGLYNPNCQRINQGKP